MIDVVYTLGSGSFSNNLELKISLASVEKWAKGVKNIYIIGDHPGFEGNFIHIPDTDRGRNRQDNIRLKIETACNIPDITDPFLFINDDHIFLKPVDVTNFPYYYNTEIVDVWKSRRKPGHYKSACENTINALSAKGLSTLNFDIHTPILYSKTLFPEVMKKYNWNSWGPERQGFIIKSLYCNTLKVPGTHYVDPKVKIAYTDSAGIEEEIKDWFMMSFDDESFTDAMKQYLQERFLTINAY